VKWGLGGEYVAHQKNKKIHIGFYLRNLGTDMNMILKRILKK